MAIHRFREVAVTREVTGSCPVCHGRTRRRQRFSQTINPWNRNDDGSVRTPEEIRQAVQAKAAAWRPDFRHHACREET